MTEAEVLGRAASIDRFLYAYVHAHASIETP